MIKKEKKQPISTKKIKLNLGCGIYCFAGWINVDNYFTKEELVKKKGIFKNATVEKGAEFIKADIKNMPFVDNYADVVEIHQVMEHFPMLRQVDYLKEIYRVMKPGGKLIIDVPSFNGLAIDWLQMIISHEFDPAKYGDVAETIFGNQYGNSEGEIHRTPFTAQYLNYILTNAGFTKGNLYIVPKGVPTPQIGELSKAKKGYITRHDILVFEGEK